jgi:DNA-binding CsgD family transcriptional regulator
MKKGAMDFIEKPFKEEELLGLVERMLDQARSAFSQHQEQASRDALLSRLTTREAQVLERIVAGRLNKQIADDLGISIKTVEAHRANIMEKLNANTVADLLKIALGAQAGKACRPDRPATGARAIHRTTTEPATRGLLFLKSPPHARPDHRRRRPQHARSAPRWPHVPPRSPPAAPARPGRHPGGRRPGQRRLCAQQGQGLPGPRLALGAREVRRHACPKPDLLARIAALNADPAIHGILVQMPCPGTSTRRRSSRPSHRQGRGRLTRCRAPAPDDRPARPAPRPRPMAA